MNDDIFSMGAADAMSKLANPAAPVKNATGHPSVDSVNAPYLQGSPKAGQHTAGPIDSRPQPWPGYVNHSKGAPSQTAGSVAQDTSPDTGEKGSTKGSENQAITKSAAFEAGVFEAVTEFELMELSDEDFEKLCSLDDEELNKLALSPQTIGSAMGKRMRQAGIKGKGLGQYSPSNLKKAMKFNLSERGQKYQRAIARKGVQVYEAVGGGKSGVVAGMIAGAKAGRAQAKAMRG